MRVSVRYHAKNLTTKDSIITKNQDTGQQSILQKSGLFFWKY